MDWQQSSLDKVIPVAERHRVSLQQLYILTLLRDADQPGVPVPWNNISSGGRTVEASLSRALRRLAERGLVKRFVARANARKRFAKITDQGRALLDSIAADLG